ncbi:3-ketoacyl-CoA thiolase B, peroxisomal-like [Schistocerca gregaria]|uniref:3-ketoacyl-CoA thiolase B, peroxisomal-like n=1 Tax=Schistocerca gregaria TaxID=7010 RepID=UPI00211E8C94|nr:3-ketoacyl-CoA thiolase B, peroxisomal-like [Schistocerca gregaria]
MDVSQNRMGKILAHLRGQPDSCSVVCQPTASQGFSDDDIVIVSAVRTPICKAKRGAFASVHWTKLLSVAARSACDRINLNPDLIEDVQVGTVLPPGGGAHPARMALLAAGFPEKTCLSATNRQCSSGLQSVATIAAAIRSGYIEIGMAAGVESMTSNDMMSAIGSLPDFLLENPKAKDCLIPMGVTSENVAEKYNIGRAEQDEFALQSQQRAGKAQREGLFKDEIVPVSVTVSNSDGSTKQVTVSDDDGIRSTTLEALQGLRPAFKQNGTTTPGNSSQVSDGAAAVILMKRRKALSLRLKPLGRFLCFCVVGVPPDIMGIGPAYAIPRAIEMANLKMSDIDIFEINEAFASQAVYCVRKLNLDIEKVNPLGGAIALGHPLGATGTRMVATLLYQLRRTGKRYGVTSMCIGTGMGAAAVFAAE